MGAPLPSSSEIKLEEVGCPLGCPRDDDAVLVARDRLHDLPGEFTVVECRTCGLMRTCPRPTVDTIGYYYPDEYKPYLSTKIDSERTGAEPGLRSSLKARLMCWLLPEPNPVPDMPTGRMLELGCASGAFLHVMAQRGWQVTGIEFSEAAAAMARSFGYDVHAGTLETVPKPEEPYDLVVGWMVLEHLHDPLRALEQLREWTKPGARLAFSVPDADSLEFKLFRRRWYALQVPSHLFHFTPATIRRLLERAGWRVERIGWVADPKNLLNSLRYVCQDHGWERADRYLQEIIDKTRLQRLSALLGKVLALTRNSGRMTVWATRRA